MRKYTGFSGTSKVKADSDQRKYEKARELKKIIGSIRGTYTQMMSSAGQADRQLGLATYLIDFLAIRAGNEKTEDKADTVGCCSLRVEHVRLMEDSMVNFRFLGKDSIEYNNTVELSQIAYENLRNLTRNKISDSQIFDLINTKKLNDFLESLMPGLTAKVFRTFNASSCLQD